MKRVICAEDIEKLAKQGQKTLCIDANAILTPSAKDAVRAAGMEISEGKSACESAPCETAACETVSPEAAASEAASCEVTSVEDEISGDLVYSALKRVLGK